MITAYDRPMRRALDRLDPLVVVCAAVGAVGAVLGLLVGAVRVRGLP